MNRHSRRKRELGSTVIEMMVVVTVMAIMAIVLAASFTVQLRLTRVMTSLSQMQNNRSIIYGLFQEQIHLASGVLDTATINGTDYTSDSDTLILQIPALDAENKVIEDVYDVGVFYVDPTDFTKLLFDRDADPLSTRGDLQGRLLTSDLETINFGYEAAQPSLSPAVSIHMVLARDVLHDVRKVPFDAYLLLRNL